MLALRAREGARGHGPPIALLTREHEGAEARLRLHLERSFVLQHVHAQVQAAQPKIDCAVRAVRACVRACVCLGCV